MWYIDKKLSNWNFIIYIQCTADGSNRCFLFISITHKLWELLVGVFTVA